MKVETAMKMKAALYYGFGEAKDVLKTEAIQVPEIGPGQVRVKLFASGVNPSDYKMRRGSRPLMGEWQIPGSDGAGMIDGVGDGVPVSRIGERVWILNAAYLRPLGTSAQYTVVENWMAQRLPDRLSYAEGACLGIPVMTAHQCVFGDGPIRGKTILVAGGAGVVGHYAIQLAKWGGASGISTISSAEKAKSALQAGADAVINYRQEDVENRVKEITNGELVDRIIEVDFGANLELNSKILKSGGVSVMYAYTTQPQLPLPIPTLMSKNITLKFTLVYTISDFDRQKIFDDMQKWLEETRPIFQIAREFKLDEVVKAHELVESGKKIGHVLLRIDH